MVGPGRAAETESFFQLKYGINIVPQRHVTANRRMTPNRLSPLRFVVAFGIVSMLANFVYEGLYAHRCHEKDCLKSLGGL